MAALPHYVPNYRQYYQYRSRQPYFLYPNERSYLKTVPLTFIPRELVNETAANIIGIPALLGYTGYATYLERERQIAAEKAKQNREELLRHLYRAPKLIEGVKQEIPVKIPKSEPEISIRPPEPPKPPPTIVDVTFPRFNINIPPTIFKVLNKGKTREINQSAVKLMNIVKDKGLDAILADPQFSNEPAIQLFTEKGFQEALYDPTKFIPTSLYPLAGNEFGDKFQKRLRTIKNVSPNELNEYYKRNKVIEPKHMVSDINIDPTDLANLAARLRKKNPQLTIREVNELAEKQIRGLQ